MEEQETRTRIYLDSQRACIEFGKMFLEQGYAVSIRKERKPNKSKNDFFIEIWREQ